MGFKSFWIYVNFNLINAAATTVVVGVRLMKRPLPRHWQQYQILNQCNPLLGTLNQCNPLLGTLNQGKISNPLSQILQRILQFYINQQSPQVTMDPHANQLHLETSMPVQHHEPV